jgi:hypothetical protein
MGREENKVGEIVDQPSEATASQKGKPVSVLVCI